MLGSLYEIVARAACFKPDVKDTSRFAQLRGVSIPKGTTLFKAVLSLVKAFLDPIDEKDALKIVYERLARFDDGASRAEELLVTDEAVEVLDEVRQACFLAGDGLCGDSVERSPTVLP